MGIKYFGKNNSNWSGKYPITKSCTICHKKFKVYTSSEFNHQLRCSAKCGYISAALKHQKRIKIKCSICGKEFISSKKHGLKRKTCSYKCMGLLAKTKNLLHNNPNWRGGKSFEPYPLGWNKTYKEQIRYRDGYRCQLCGCHEIECRVKLHVHHIDYEKNNLRPENLISLCNSCHVKTNGRREYWKGYFNESRNKANTKNNLNDPQRVSRRILL
jgi:5-methylcytosine-specific restriction endonuclease McrA